MTDYQKSILIDYYDGHVAKEKLLEVWGEVLGDIEAVKRILQDAMKEQNVEHLELSIKLIWLSNSVDQFIDELNLLLLDPNHRSHQLITKTIQDLKNPKSIPFIRKALASKFDYLAYTCSESAVIAKWFSWALFSIGTKEAIDVIKEYADAEDEGVRKEMRYRWRKLTENNPF